jgi:hypothetical protein
MINSSNSWMVDFDLFLLVADICYNYKLSYNMINLLLQVYNYQSLYSANL